MEITRRVFSVAAIIFLSTIILSASQARADSIYGVRETPTEILIDVPRFCKSVTFVWEIRWEQDGGGEEMMDALLRFIEADKGAKLTVPYLRIGDLKLSAPWRGGQTLHLPKFDAKGRPIKIKFLSIIAYGGGPEPFSKNNWLFMLSDGKAIDISAPVNAGIWGKC